MANKTSLLAFTGATLIVSALGGCDTYDPLLREGMWHPTHPSHANATLMAANPADLVRGHGVSGSDAQLDVAAIDRLYANKVKKLPDAGLSDVTVKSQGGTGE